MTKRKYTIEYFQYKGVTYASNNMGPYLAARHGDKINYGNKVTCTPPKEKVAKTESRSGSIIPFVPTLVKRYKRNSVNVKPPLPPLPTISTGQKETGKVENNSASDKIAIQNPVTPITPPPYLT